MKASASKLRLLIEEALPELKAIPGEVFAIKPSPVKWSKKEILGHLVDSAQNNIRRFIVAQYEEKPFVKYAQEKWVVLSGYQDEDANDIIDLWYLLNKHICSIWEHTPENLYERLCQTETLHSIQWLAEDYIKHLLHHLHVILEREPIAYP